MNGILRNGSKIVVYPCSSPVDIANLSFLSCTSAMTNCKAAIAGHATGVAKHKGNTILPLVM